MGLVVRGPWQYKAEIIQKEGNGASYKTMNYFLAKEKQEDAYKNNIYLELFIINNDYNRTFLIFGTKEGVELQISFRTSSSTYLNNIKASL